MNSLGNEATTVPVEDVGPDTLAQQAQRSVTIISPLYPGTSYRQIRTLFGGSTHVAAIHWHVGYPVVVECTTRSLAELSLQTLMGDDTIAASLMLRQAEPQDVALASGLISSTSPVKADNDDNGDNASHDNASIDEEGEVALPAELARIQQQLLDEVLARIEEFVVKGVQRAIQREVCHNRCCQHLLTFMLWLVGCRAGYYTRYSRRV
jgi:hypothetical protein